ncbi:MAG: hypothetical protein AB2L07_15735 [Thermoanaerobaculaceae bacterium]
MPVVLTGNVLVGRLAARAVNRDPGGTSHWPYPRLLRSIVGPVQWGIAGARRPREDAREQRAGRE